MGMGIFSGGVAAMVDIAARRQRRPFKEAPKMMSSSFVCLMVGDRQGDRGERMCGTDDPFPVGRRLFNAARQNKKEEAILAVKRDKTQKTRNAKDKEAYIYRDLAGGGVVVERDVIEIREREMKCFFFLVRLGSPVLFS